LEFEARNRPEGWNFCVVLNLSPKAASERTAARAVSMVRK
jgi:hypothetical protein